MVSDKSYNLTNQSGTTKENSCEQNNQSNTSPREQSIHACFPGTCTYATFSCFPSVPVHLLANVVPYRHHTIRTSHGNYTGYDLDYFKLITETINGTYSIVEPRDSGWGTLSDNKTWDGVVAEIVSGRSDIALSDFTVDYERYQVI